jgi:hypothetical protein
MGKYLNSRLMIVRASAVLRSATMLRSTNNSHAAAGRMRFIQILGVVAAIALIFWVLPHGEVRHLSIIDLGVGFIYLLIGMGPLYLTPLATVFVYCVAYKIELRRAAAADHRNYMRRRTRFYMSVVFWERVARLDIRTMMYLACSVLVPLLWLAATVGRMSRGSS